MAIVLPDGILGNRNTAYVREWIKSVAAIRAIVSLPLEAFAPFGASVKTSVLILRKFQPGEDKSRDYRIFLADLQNIGHDAAGRPSKCDDFGRLVSDFRAFIEAEGW